MGSQAAFGETFGIGNQAAMTLFLNGGCALSLKAARGFAAGLGCRIADFSPRLAALAGDALAPDEQRLLGLYRDLPPREQRRLMLIADAMQIDLPDPPEQPPRAPPSPPPLPDAPRPPAIPVRESEK